MLLVPLLGAAFVRRAGDEVGGSGQRLPQHLQANCGVGAVLRSGMKYSMVRSSGTPLYNGQL